MVDCWLVVFYYYYTTTNTNTNTYVLVRAVWQLETAGGGRKMEGSEWKPGRMGFWMVIRTETPPAKVLRTTRIPIFFVIITTMYVKS